MKLVTTFCAIFTLALTLAAAAPADLPGFSAIDARDALTKRATSCSNGIAVSCKNAGASVSCSGSQCTYCCGSCCKKAKGEDFYIMSPRERVVSVVLMVVSSSAVEYELQ